jgi:ABC-type uncharacterized transport system involved in gliding motility auxiliary subunit
MANFSGENVLKDFKPSETEYALAIRLTGKFKTAFPNGKPEDKADAEKKDGDKKPEEKPAEKKPDDSLKEGKQESSVILVGDADMLFDRVALREVQTLFGTAYTVANGNLSFAQGAVEQLSGDNNLISVRSRATLNRPFTRVKDMELEASKKYQGEMKRLQDKATETQRKLDELQQSRKDKDQRFVLSPEQIAERDKFYQERADTRKRLRQLEKDYRKEVVSLQTNIKWMNTLAVPAAVAFSGILIAVINRRKTSAK